MKKKVSATHVAELRDVVWQSFQRHNELALITQATVVSTAISIGRLRLFNGMKIPELNAIFDYPKTDESQRAAGFVVTSCNAMVHCVGMGAQINHTWPRMFWNACYNLQPCDP